MINQADLGLKLAWNIYVSVKKQYVLEVPGHAETLAGAWQIEGRLNARVALILKPRSGSLRSLTMMHRHFSVLLISFRNPLQHVGVGTFVSPPTKGRHAERLANCSLHSRLSAAKSEKTKLNIIKTTMLETMTWTTSEHIVFAMRRKNCVWF